MASGIPPISLIPMAPTVSIDLETPDPLNPNPIKSRPTPVCSVPLILEALEHHKGFMSAAARDLGVTVQALSQRIKRNKKLKIAYDAINEEKLDVSESKLGELIDIKDLNAIKFHLECKGKHRGWVRRQEMTGAGGGPIKTATNVRIQRIDLSGLSDEELTLAESLGFKIAEMTGDGTEMTGDGTEIGEDDDQD